MVTDANLIVSRLSTLTQDTSGLTSLETLGIMDLPMMDLGMIKQSRDDFNGDEEYNDVEESELKLIVILQKKTNVWFQ